MISMFLLGMIGALAPEIIRLYALRNTPRRFRWSGFYLVVSLLFSALGGSMAVVLPATTPWGALYVGVATRVLINSLVKKRATGGKARLRNADSPPPEVSIRAFVDAL